MDRKTSNFAIGLFVTVGIIIAVVSIIWLGATKYLEEGRYAFVYFDESVQGLQADSSVKFRGVDVGRVERISVAPDNRLIEVLLKITAEPTSPDPNLREKLAAQLKSSGITGIMFIEMDYIGEDEAVLLPDMDPEPEHPVFASRPSNIKQLRSGMAILTNKIQEFDAKGISEELKGTIASINKLVSSEDAKNTVSNVSSLVENLNSLTAKIDKAVDEKEVEEIIAGTVIVMEEIQILVAKANEELDSMQLGDTVEKASNAIEDMNRNTNDIADDLKLVSENLLTTSRSLDDLIRRLEESPSDLLFSAPAPPRRGE